MAELADAADSKGEPTAEEIAGSEKHAGSDREETGRDGAGGQSAGIHDDLRAALRLAIAKEDTVTVRKVMDEMRALREAAAGVVSLDAARARKGKG